MSWMTDVAVVVVAGGQAGRVPGRARRRAHLLDPQSGGAPPLAYASGDYSPARLGIYAEIGSGPDEAYARLRAAEASTCGTVAGRSGRELQKALAFWRKVGRDGLRP